MVCGVVDAGDCLGGGWWRGARGLVGVGVGVGVRVKVEVEVWVRAGMKGKCAILGNCG